MPEEIMLFPEVPKPSLLAFSSHTDIPRIEFLEVRNYRALKDVTLKKITPITALLGPNGSGKSTVFDVFAFLSECFTVGLRKAWDSRGRFKELRTRGETGPISFEIKYRELPEGRDGSKLITYHLAINEDIKGPYVAEEWLSWRRQAHGQPFKFLNFSNGVGEVISGDEPEANDKRIAERLVSREILAVNTLGQFAAHPRVSSLRNFISGWYLSYLTAENTRIATEAGPQEKLSNTGDNLSNVIQYLKEQKPEELEYILSVLRKGVPRLQSVDSDLMPDGRLLLTIKDAPFEQPILARYASDGTLKMLAYLIVLFDPDPSPFVGIEEPENHLHPRLLPGLAEECRNASVRTQLMVTTHSPFFVNGLRPNEVWIIARNKSGHTEAKCAASIQGIREFMDEGALLGDLWLENYFRFGDPLNS